mmetsp:Transcript_31027/g.92266  ORF Transcript_31027/g.92266 Transcript_31027/m.92266 type:complete len:233 (-) Transcript_31027:1893-2591(-)
MRPGAGTLQRRAKVANAAASTSKQQQQGRTEQSEQAHAQQQQAIEKLPGPVNANAAVPNKAKTRYGCCQRGKGSTTLPAACAVLHAPMPRPQSARCNLCAYSHMPAEVSAPETCQKRSSSRNVPESCLCAASVCKGAKSAIAAGRTRGASACVRRVESVGQTLTGLALPASHSAAAASPAAPLQSLAARLAPRQSRAWSRTASRCAARGQTRAQCRRTRPRSAPAPRCWGSC